MLLPITSLPLTDKETFAGSKAKPVDDSVPTDLIPIRQEDNFDDWDSDGDIDVRIVNSAETELIGHHHDEADREAIVVDQGAAAAPVQHPTEPIVQRPDAELPAEALEQPMGLRRSGRERKPPAWMASEQYVMSQNRLLSKSSSSPTGYDNPADSNRESGVDDSWSVTERINLLKILNSEGVFTGIPSNVAESIWKSIVT